MLDSTILLLALASPVPVIAPVEQGPIPSVATSWSDLRLADQAMLDDAPEGRVSDHRADNTASRWDGAGAKFVVGTAGGAIGAVGGGFIGGVIAASMVRGSGNLSDLAYVLLGGMFGSAVGGTTMTAVFVKMMPSEAYPSRSIWPALGGSVLGVVAGGVVVGQVARLSNDVDWGIWPAIGTLVLSSSAGAVLLDRAVASPASFSVAPWSPRPGVQGARVGLVF